jgi:hypothetical protein
MSHSYRAFIDESGDDGFGKFRQRGALGGQSHWLVLTALVIRRTNELEAVRWRDEIARMRGKGRELHFVNLDHQKRVAAAKHLAACPVRMVSVLISKPHLEPATFTQKNQLYFFAARFLIERLSWLCRDLRPTVPEGNGQVAITFSRRGGMSYPGFRDYLARLKTEQTTIHWPVIDIAAVAAQSHSDSASLQLADLAASSFACAVEPDRYGNVELRYALILKERTYARAGNIINYGLKFFPGGSLGASHQDLLDGFNE